MSCTDDKTACPCEPGEELRRFEAADLKAAVLADEETWYKLEAGVYYDNPDYDAALYAEYQALSDAYYKVRYNERTNEDYAKITAFRDLHGTKLQSHLNKPWTFKWNGKELPVTVVEDNGGSEGGGEAVHMVYKVCDRLFRLDGSYYSYDGTHWDDDSFREVKAVERVVTYYE